MPQTAETQVYAMFGKATGVYCYTDMQTMHNKSDRGQILEMMKNNVIFYGTRSHKTLLHINMAQEVVSSAGNDTSLLVI